MERLGCVLWFRPNFSVYETQNCMLLDISQTGARLELERPLGVNASGYLRVGPIEVFATAVRLRMGEETGGVNGLEFDIRLTKSQVLAVRAMRKITRWPKGAHS